LTEALQFGTPGADQSISIPPQGNSNLAIAGTRERLGDLLERSNSGERPLPPHGERVELDGRGSIFVRGVDGPRGALPVVLVHGWVASGGLNWFRAFDPLGRHFRVIAPDMRGHGRGIRSFRPFQLEDCADDIAALLETMGIGPAVIVGYSMGGPVAQLLWRRHRDRVAGLVMVATSARPVRTDRAARVLGHFMSSAALAGRIPEYATWLPRLFARGAGKPRKRQRATSMSTWARAEMRRHNLRHLLEAGAELGRYDARGWVGEIDVPTAVIVTERDRAMPASAQLALAKSIPRASVHRLDAGHLSCVAPDFGHTVVAACRDVAERL
jgi:pimeloyl-ACP methyl ester carboxylesterase